MNDIHLDIEVEVHLYNILLIQFTKFKAQNCSYKKGKKCFLLYNAINKNILQSC